MPEPEAQLQATANLSPVSPSPVHTAATLAVPALQETVDTIDAMVAAAMASDGAVDHSDVAAAVHDSLVDGDNDGIVDDDSFDGAYGEDAPETTSVQQQPAQQPDDNDNDDYAKTFDSPIGPGEGEDMGGDEGETLQQDVSSLTRESNNLSLASDHLTTTTSRPLDAARAVPEPSALLPGAADATAAPSAAHVKGDAHPALASSSASSHSAGTQHQDGQPAQSRDAAHPVTTAFVASQDPSADIQQLVADLTSQPVDSASNPDQSDASASANAEQATASTSPVSALPPSSSLPPRPPLPQANSQSYAAQHHPAGVNSSIPPSTVAPPTPGQPSTYVASGAPGATADSLSALPPPPATGLNAPVAVTSINPPPFPADRSQDAEYQRQWDQFMIDERQYMSEAKWDRFPEGSRIFIGTRSASGASQTGAHIFSTGNLSSDKVSKRDVFDLFHRFGRLAQISLKSAYGFVQYHTVEEGQLALENLQGIEIKGRRVREYYAKNALEYGIY
jgi:nuclear polyadenylated RNA-binding protein 3